jgi:hypothetical protein
MKSWDGISARELELLMRNLAKSNPPPILHRYRRDSDWTIKELTVPEVHVAGVSDMNDPFEYRTPLEIDEGKLRARFLDYARERGMDQKAAIKELESFGQNSAKQLADGFEKLRNSSGLICCSANPRSNRMWAYYAGGHKGICVGYSTDYSPFNFARKVTYRDPDGSLDLAAVLSKDPTLLSDNISCRKGSEWEFEEEFRIPIGPFSNEHTRLLPIRAEAIVEIRLGTNISSAFKHKVLGAIRPLPQKPRVIQMGCDHDSFQLTENEAPIT